jgi:hypothetical protein
MKKRLLLFALLAVSLMAIIPNTTSAQVLPNPTQDIPVVGAFTNGTFEGTLDIVRFAQSGSQIVAIGSLTGTLTDAVGNTVGSVSGMQVQLPVSQIIGSCEILHLELGPLDLDLLGLVVHLDQVVLDISAEAGPGNLLGNLLCAITGLLDGGPLFLIIGLLNQILGILG